MGFEFSSPRSILCSTCIRRQKTDFLFRILSFAVFCSSSFLKNPLQLSVVRSREQGTTATGDSKKNSKEGDEQTNKTLQKNKKTTSSISVVRTGRETTATQIRMDEPRRAPATRLWRDDTKVFRMHHFLYPKTADRQTDTCTRHMAHGTRHTAHGTWQKKIRYSAVPRCMWKQQLYIFPSAKSA